MTKITLLKIGLVVQVMLRFSSTLNSQSTNYAISRKDLNVPQAKLSQVASKIEFIPLEFNRDCTIDMFYGYQVAKAGDNWLVWSIVGNGFIFNPDGKYLGKVGKKGKGPGEYTQFRRITWDEGSKKYLMLLTQNRVNVYNPDGSFDRQVKYNIDGEIWKIAILKDKWILLESVPQGGDFVKLQYQYSDNKGVTRAPVTIDLKNIIGNRPYFTDWNSFYVYDEMLRFGGYPPYIIYQLDRLNKWESIYSFEIPVKQLPDNLNPMPPNNAEFENFVATYGKLDWVQEFNNFFLVRFTSPKRNHFLVRKGTRELLNCSYDENSKLGVGLIDDLAGGPCFLPMLETRQNEWITLISSSDLIEKSQPHGRYANELRNAQKKVDQNSNPVIIKVTLITL